MIENDILKLSGQSGRALDQLEKDIWLGVEARLRAARDSRTVLSCQAAVLIIALVGSIVAGAHAAAADDPRSGLGVFSTRADLSPSTRLIGH
jgi:hypothetical protein